MSKFLGTFAVGGRDNLMSKLKQRNGDDHPEAAGKHLDDAATLLAANRFDGAAYLTGYGVECSLKSVIRHAGKKPWGHDLSGLSRTATRLASIPGSQTARYSFQTPIGSTLFRWSETLRYREVGEVSPAEATSWQGDAKAIYHATVAKMRLDGVL